MYCWVFEAVGIVREMNICEARATRGSVCMRASGILKWRVVRQLQRRQMLNNAVVITAFEPRPDLDGRCMALPTDKALQQLL